MAEFRWNSCTDCVYNVEAVTRSYAVWTPEGSAAFCSEWDRQEAKPPLCWVKNGIGRVWAVG